MVDDLWRQWVTWKRWALRLVLQFRADLAPPPLPPMPVADDNSPNALIPGIPSLQIVPLSTFPPSCCNFLVALEHTWDQEEELPPSVMANNSSLDASSKANRRVFQSGPFTQWSTLFINEARSFNLSVRFHSSTRENNRGRLVGTLDFDDFVCILCLRLF